jgi:hypothetical protein
LVLDGRGVTRIVDDAYREQKQVALGVDAGPDPPFVEIDDRAANRKSHAQAVVLGGEERHEQMRQDIGGDYQAVKYAPEIEI